MFNIIALPYFTTGPWPKEPLFYLGHTPIQIQPFGLLVAVGIFWAMSMGSWKAERKFGVDKQKWQNLAFYLLVFGWLTSHIVDLLFYHTDLLFRDPTVIFRIGGTFSSYGGVFGGILGAFVWGYRNKEKDFLLWADLAVFTVPFGWLFGRMGCSIVHDHPGKLAESFPLAIEYADPSRPYLNGIRHDLGFYEFLWWVFIVLCVIFWFERKPRPKGFYIAVLPIMYTPIRFLLDFLRLPASQNGDSRYWGLTPAQYFSVFFFGIGIFFLMKINKTPVVEWSQFVSKEKKPSTKKPIKKKKSKKKK